MFNIIILGLALTILFILEVWWVCWRCWAWQWC